MRHYYGMLSAALAVAMALLLTACLSGGGGGNSGASSSSPSAPSAPTTCTSVTYAAPSGAANNIVFTFDKAYTCGQFANGDWWVSKDANPTVTITAITPTAAGGRYGFEVNPSAGSITQQGFDNTSSVTYNAALMPALPLSLSGVSSVVKTVAGTPNPPGDLSVLQFAAVLTIVDTPVSSSSNVFRPGYFGTTGKTFYPVPSAATVAGLPAASYTPVGVPSLAGFSIASVATRYQGVQLDHNEGFRGRTTHPIDNMPDYGLEIAIDNAVYLLRLLLSDFSYSNATHKQALINYLQMAIDLKSMADGGVLWFADGGHGNGRKLPLQVAHKVFGGTDFSNAIAASIFSEDQQVYRSGVTGEVLWGKRHLFDQDDDYWRTTRGALGELAPGGAKDIRDTYGRIDGGGYEVGVGSEYQVCCTSKPWKYAVLALYMLGLETPPTSLPLPATTPLVEYVERWVRFGVKAVDNFTNIDLTVPAPGGISSPTHISVNPLLTVCARPAVPSAVIYLTDFGPLIRNAYPIPSACITGTNNWVTQGDGNDSVNGGPGNTFGEELWDWFR